MDGFNPPVTHLHTIQRYALLSSVTSLVRGPTSPFPRCFVPPSFTHQVVCLSRASLLEISRPPCPPSCPGGAGGCDSGPMRSVQLPPLGRSQSLGAGAGGDGPAGSGTESTGRAGGGVPAGAQPVWGGEAGKRGDGGCGNRPVGLVLGWVKKRSKWGLAGVGPSPPGRMLAPINHTTLGFG